ncbi:unnamed protein product [Rotaria sordida]|uniref:Uncharacterized protein n=2 Tax=Rotaria sordida TaxID=392033 RepID=A0A815SYF6_9BILA|nr:unnamed protein product [Rotaria sordida]
MIVTIGLIPVYLRATSKPSVVEEKCVPNLANDKISLAQVSLLDADEFAFNNAERSITIKLECPILDVDNYTIFANGEPIENTNHTKDSIMLSGFSSGATLLSLFALDTYGLPIFTSFQLYFGLITMPVRVFYANGTVAFNVVVNLNLTDNPRISQSGVTDDRGMITFNHVPALTISIFAHTKDNQIALAGIAPSESQISLTLIPFNDGKKLNEIENREYLSVTTVGQSLQTISRSFITQANANEAYIEYQFVTSEVPGGYFGSQFNDYFSVTLRSEKGNFITKTDSMNGLGLGAFEFATGATGWSNLTVKVGSTPEKIRFDVGVSNVGDGAFQSTVNIRKYGADQCDDCEKECVKCTSDPMCSSACLNPPMQSCAFYLSCMETKVSCGADGYALGYGFNYCTKFSNALQSFSSQGQTWIWNTMNCLQNALVSPLKNCEKSCSTLRQIAFNAHPKCYIDNGVCNLPALDWPSIVTIVGKDLLTLDGFIQALKTGPQCIPTILQRINTQLQQALIPAKKIALLIVKVWFESL